MERTLARGGFAITYLALDGLLNREVVLKEYAPVGSIRGEDGTLVLPQETQQGAHEFLREARTLTKLRVPGVVNVVDAFFDGGTTYVVMEYLPDALPMERLLRSSGTFSNAEVRHFLTAVLTTLHDVHELGFLHRDLKPSNILMTGTGPVLIDFGAAREWQADATVQHTTLFTPGYAPIEQLSEKGRRGPASDLYALAATAYELLTGAPPPSAIDRLAGVPLPPLPHDVDSSLTAVLQQALALRASDRPQSAKEMLAMLSESAPTHAVIQKSRLDAMDEAMTTLRLLKIRRNECPTCGSVMMEPKPLTAGTCPVCRSGKIERRDLEEGLCAVCTSGYLREIRNESPLRFCPLCATGKLAYPTFLRGADAKCDSCGAIFQRIGSSLTLQSFGSKESALVEEGTRGDWDFWRRISGRSSRIYECDTCESQWDARGDALTLVYVTRDTQTTKRTLHRKEWARVAKGLSIDAGSHTCRECGADYFIENDFVTLLDAMSDPYGFASRNQGRRIELTAMRWMGAGKTSGARGLLCEECNIEFDYDGDYLRLRAAQSLLLQRHIGEAHTLEDWHRLARQLPVISDESKFYEEFDECIRNALLSGELDETDILFRAAAELIENGSRVSSGELLILQDKVEYRNKRDGFAAPIDVVDDFSQDGDILSLWLSGEREPIELYIHEETVEVELGAGIWKLKLSASDAATTLALQKERKAAVS